jgi:diguanylate cyclase (GGDEF)-like protein
MFLDVQTLTFAGGLVSLSSGLLVLLYWLQDRTSWVAFWWAMGSIGSGMGIFLLALHGAVPPFASDILGPWLLDVCAVVPWVTARIFSRLSINPYLVLAGVGTWIMTEAFAGAFGSEQLAIAVGIVISGCLYAAGAIEFWRARAEQLRGRWPMISALGVFAFALFLASIGLSTATHQMLTPSVGWLGIIHFVGLVYAVVGAISLIMMLKERSEAIYKAAALTDPLTGFANRRSFMDRAQRVFDRNAGDDKPISLLAFDLDRFKRINDTFGHPVGDQVLRMFADGLSWALRPADIAARIGGEEFAVVLPGCSVQAALAIADRIRASFQENALFVNGQRVGATVSVGIATSLGRPCDLLGVLASADGALYQAKASGRNRIVQADDSGIDLTPAKIIRIA